LRWTELRSPARDVVSAPGAGRYGLSIEAIDRRLENSVKHARRRTLAGVCDRALPLALPGLLAGMVLGFAKAIVRVRCTLPLCPTFPARPDPFPRIYSLIQTPRRCRGGRLVLISIVIAMAR